MTRLNGMDILLCMNDVDDGLVMESMELLGPVLMQPPAPEPRRGLFGLYGASAWAAAVGIVAAVGLTVSLILGAPKLTGMLAALLHPDETRTEETTADEPEETTPEEIESSEEDSEAETRDPTAYTEGLVVVLIQGVDRLYATVDNYTGTDPDVVIPSEYRGNPVTAIGAHAFYSSRNECEITSVYIPEGVRAIGNSAFRACSELKSLHLPASIEVIDEMAFMGCGNLESITVEEGNPYFHAVNNCLIETATGKLILGCKNSVIPDDGSVRTIGFGAFYECEGLTEITIPASVGSMEDKCFYGCASLERVQIDAPLTSLGEGGFYGCAMTEIDLPETLIEISQSVFAKCARLSSVTIPDGVRSVMDSAFYECAGLSEITIPASVTFIGYEAFGYCEGITRVVVEANVTSLELAFSSCTGMREIHLPASLTKIGSNDFFQCRSLTDIYYGGTCARWIEIGGMEHYSESREILIHCSDGELTFEEVDSDVSPT